MKIESNIAKTAGSLGGSNFLISIHHQENQSWQGVIEWLDTGKKVHFRSVFEMLSLIDEAVMANTETDQSHRKWGDIKTYHVV